MIRNSNNLIAGAVNTVDHSEKEGYWVTLSSALLPTLGASATVKPHAVILQGRGIGASDDLQPMVGDKIVDVRAGGACTGGSMGMTVNDGTFIDDSSGARETCCRFLDSGVAGDLVRAILFQPVTGS
jgi:hypothetical protein